MRNPPIRHAFVACATPRCDPCPGNMGTGGHDRWFSGQL